VYVVAFSLTHTSDVWQIAFWHGGPSILWSCAKNKLSEVWWYRA